MTTLTWIEETYRSLSPLSVSRHALGFNGYCLCKGRKIFWLLKRQVALFYSPEKEKPRIDQEGQGTCQARDDGRLICTVCDFDFLKFYGKRGKDFAEAHHMIPVSEMSEDASSKPEDMAIVCANCHRMLHHPLRQPR